MFHSLIQFSTLAAGMQEEHPPVELTNPFNFGLSPFGVIVVVLLVIAMAWVALNAQAGRADLHVTTDHSSGHHEEH